MKRKLLLITALFVALCLSMVGIVACNDTEPVDPSKQSIEITNTAALTSKWNVGEADRTVEVKLSDGLKDKAVTLTAEPAGIVTIDGMKLTAAKKGTTQVTAKVTLDAEHEYTDSVEITVNYNYTLTISNKAELVKAFRLGEADRELNIALSDAIKNNTVEITTSDKNVVSVDGKKIKAVNKGEATITATTTLDGVSFKDSFKVKVWGAFDLTIDNLAAFANPIGKSDEPIEIEYTMTEAGDYTAADVTITSSKTTVAEIVDGKVNPVGVGTTTITVACGDVERTIEVTVEVLPVLTIGEFDQTVSRYVGESFEIPAIITATDSQERDVKDTVQVTCDNANLTIGSDKVTVSADQIGKYTVTYKFTDASKGEKKVELTFDIVDKFFSATGAHAGTDEAAPLGDAKFVTKLEGEDGNYKQVTTSNRDALVFGKLNGEASKYYYAEATFAVGNSSADCDATLALGHFSAENERYAYLSKLASYSGDFLNIDVTFNKTDNVSKGSAEANGQTCMYTYNVMEVKHIDRLAGDQGSDRVTTLVTIAIARDGDYFYSFINGQYVNCITPKTLRDVDTIPAIVGKWMSKGEIELTDIVYLADESEVTAKLYSDGGLLGGNKEKMFVPYIDSNDNQNASHGAAYGDNVSIDTSLTSQQNGLAFTYTNGKNADLNGTNNQNGATVSPYIYFDGNFTFSWELKLTDIKALHGSNTSNADNYRSILELKTNAIGYDVVQLGMGPGSNKKTGGSFKMSVKGYTSTGNTDGWRKYCEPSTNDVGTTGLNALTIGDNGSKVRFSLTRIIHEGSHAEYIMTATVIGDETKTYTRIVNIGGSETSVTSGAYTTAHSQYDAPMLPYWRNSGVSGEFTNITWSLLPDNISSEFVADGTNALTLTTVNEKRATNDTGSEYEEVESDVLRIEDVIYNQDVIIDLGEAHSLESGEYTVKITANGDKKIDFGSNKYNRYDLEFSDVYTATVVVTDNCRYLKLNGITLGHGTYNITFSKVTAPEA